MNPLIAKIVLVLASVAMIVIRSPHGQRSRQTAVAKSHRHTQEVMLLALAWLGFFVPLFWVATPFLAFADYVLSPMSLAGGTVCFALGLWLLYRSHKDLGTNWSITLEIRAQHQLVTHGIYERVRHPMYTAFLFYGLGQALVVPNLIAGPSYVIAFATLVMLRLGREEQMMLAEFGPQYQLYRMRTKRLVPGVF